MDGGASGAEYNFMIGKAINPKKQVSLTVDDLDHTN